MCGIAVATMAMICVLSVYNGFQDFLASRASSIIPDVEVRPASGKVIADADSLASALSLMKEVEVVTPVLDDNMMLYSNYRMVPVRVLGVDSEDYSRATGMESILMPGSRLDLDVYSYTDEGSADRAEGEETDDTDRMAQMDFNEDDLEVSAESLYAGDEEMLTPKDLYVPPVILSNDVLTHLYGDTRTDIWRRRESRVSLMVPRRTGTISTVNLGGAFLMNEMGIAGGVVTDKSNFGGNLAIISLALARDMLEYDTEASSLYLKASGGITPETLAKKVSEKIGPGYEVVDRDSQLSVHFNMMRIEKWFTFLLLAFILMIASFNIISTLSMLIVDKRRSIAVMHRLGASKGLIGEVFCWESCYVCLAGTFAGLASGLLLCWLQMRYGFIGIPNAGDNLVVDSYPVAIRWSDVAWLMVPSALIAFFTSVISSGFARRSPATFHD